MRPLRLFFPFVFLFVLLAGCSGGLDTSGLTPPEAARLILTSLGTGDQRVQTAIDWDLFRVDSHNIAAEYRLQTTDQGKRAFRETCINNFPPQFSANGYNPGILTNWTQVSDDANWTVVTATGERGAKTTMTFSKRNGQRLLAALDLPH